MGMVQPTDDAIGNEHNNGTGIDKNGIGMRTVH